MDESKRQEFIKYLESARFRGPGASCQTGFPIHRGYRSYQYGNGFGDVVKGLHRQLIPIQHSPDKEKEESLKSAMNDVSKSSSDVAPAPAAAPLENKERSREGDRATSQIDDLPPSAPMEGKAPSRKRKHIKHYKKGKTKQFQNVKKIKYNF